MPFLIRRGRAAKVAMAGVEPDSLLAALHQTFPGLECVYMEQ